MEWMLEHGELAHLAEQLRQSSGLVKFAFAQPLSMKRHGHQNPVGSLLDPHFFQPLLQHPSQDSSKVDSAIVFEFVDEFSNWPPAFIRGKGEIETQFPSLTVGADKIGFPFGREGFGAFGAIG